MNRQPFIIIEHLCLGENLKITQMFFHCNIPTSCPIDYRIKCRTAGQDRVTSCINALSTAKPSSQSEHALNRKSWANQHFLMYLWGLGGLMYNSLHFHGSNFHSLMEWNMLLYWGVEKNVSCAPHCRLENNKTLENVIRLISLLSYFDFVI